jgi:hypothetical protein
VDPDPKGKKTCGPGGSGFKSGTLVTRFVGSILPPSINAIWAPDEQAKLVLNIESYSKIFHYLVQKSKIF